MIRGSLASLASLTVLGLASSALGAPPADGPALEVVALPSPGASAVDVRVLFRVGSVDDPPGKAGLAALTARMLGDAATAKRSQQAVKEALYPMAADWSVLADKEATTFIGRVHQDHLQAYTDLLLEALLQPGFRDEDLARHKDQLRAHLTTTLKAASDELLGFETLNAVAFQGHPYGTPVQGTLSGLDAITMDDVRQFYRTHYTRPRTLLGLAGGFTPEYQSRLAGRLAEGLPATGATRPDLPAPPPVTGRHVTLVEKPTDSTGIHFARPIPVRPGHPDYLPLAVAASFLGEHRTFHGRLMQQLRGLRGLNYGDYAYVEHYHNPPGTSQPTPGVARQQQLFTVWVRPVAPDKAHFALRAALFYTDQLVREGLTQAQLDLTRDFLMRYAQLWRQTASRRLGFAMDGRLYGIDSVIDALVQGLPALTLDQVNAAIRRHLTTADLHVVMVTRDAQPLATALKADTPSPITYDSPVPPEVTADDALIQTYPVTPASVRVVPVDQLFR